MNHTRFDIPVTTRLPEPLRNSIDQAAARQGLHRAEYIRNALRVILAAEVAVRQNGAEAA